MTNAVTTVTGGSKLHLKIQETIFHAGHYRVALAVNSRNELPPDPCTVEKWTDRGLYSVRAQVPSPPQSPVIADGLFPHYPKPGEPMSAVPKTPMGSGGAKLAGIVGVRESCCRWIGAGGTVRRRQRTATPFPPAALR